MSETLIMQPDQENQAAINAEQVAATARIDQMESEMEGAYSSLGNRHTYMVDAEGKKQVIKRADALEKADQLNAARQQQVESVSEQGEAQEAPAVEAQDSVAEEKIAEPQEVPQEPVDVDKLIDDWAVAEIDGDQDKANLAQDGLQESMVAASEAGELKNDEVSDTIDLLDFMKNERKSEVLEARAKREHVSESRSLRAEIGQDDQQPSPALFDYEKEVDQTPEPSVLFDYEKEVGKAPESSATLEPEVADAEVVPPSTETVSAVMGEVAKEQKITLKDRWNRLKNATVLLPVNLASRSNERLESMSKRNKIIAGVGAAAIVGVGAYTWHKFGVDGGGSRGGSSPDALSSGNPNPVNLGDAMGGAGDSVGSVANTPESAGIDTTQLSWGVAHKLSPGNENSIIQNAIDEYNNARGTNFALNPQNNWIMDGPRAINPAEMADLNNLMKS